MESKWQLFFRKLETYPILLFAIAILGILGFFLLSTDQKKNPRIYLSLSIIVLVAFYENLAGFFGSQGISNSWVYNLFNGHVSAVLFFFLIRNFLKEKYHKNVVLAFLVLFLLLSGMLHLLGFVHFNDGGEYISFINTVLILCSCGLYFFELITLDEFLEINPLQEFSFWACTAILFYFSSSFMIYISVTYLYTNHLDIYWMVTEIPKTMAILCNLLLCFSIFSFVIKDKYHLEIVHV